jgi:hypothetical protein
MKNYIEAAKNNEIIFRLILDKFGVNHKDLSINEIHTEYSEGNRYGIWTILNFEEKEPNIFEFSSQLIAALAGRGSTDLWTIENDKLKYVNQVVSWMS